MMTYFLVIVSFTLGFMFSALLNYRASITDEQKKKKSQELYASDYVK